MRRCTLFPVIVYLALPLSVHAFRLRPATSSSRLPCRPISRRRPRRPLALSANDYDENRRKTDDPFTIPVLEPNQLRIVRPIGEQRLTVEEETETRDGAGPRGAFGRIRNKKSRTEQPAQIRREMRNMGVGARLFEAVDTRTGQALVLKEFLPMMKNVAMGEVELYRYLYDWTRRNQPAWLPSDLPLVPLHGYLTTGPEVEDPSFVQAWRDRFGPSLPPPVPGNVWVAVRAARLLPLTSVPRLALGDAEKFPLASPGRAGWWGRLWGKGGPDRVAYLKNVFEGSITAVSLLHQAGVVHGAVSPSTILVSTADLREGGREGGMEVWLSELGFATNVLSQGTLDFEGLVKRDWKGCSYALLEVFLRLLAEEEEGEGEGGDGLGKYEEGFTLPFAQVEAGGLQAVTEERFKGDVSVGLRSLVNNERAYQQAVACLDAKGGAGWVLLHDMANAGRLVAQEGGVYGVGPRLLASSFWES